MNILLFGPPGAGKGTQSSLLVKNLKMLHISTGDLFRMAIKERTKLGIEAKGFIDKGELVPDSVTIKMVDDVLSKVNSRSFILDGFPRNVSQAEALADLLLERKINISKAIFLEVDTESLVLRLSGRRVCRACGAVYHITEKRMKNGKNCDECGSEDIYQRDDDRAESIRKRLEVYAEYTNPLKDYYAEQKCLISINGMGKVEEVYNQIEVIIKGQISVD